MFFVLDSCMINRQAMISKAFMVALSEDLPVLFAYIGWANKYNGIDEVFGGIGIYRTTRITTRSRMDSLGKTMVSFTAA